MDKTIVPVDHVSFGLGNKARPGAHTTDRDNSGGFEWALQHACLASYSRAVFDSRDEWQQNMAASPVRIQWDPERDIHLNALPYRAIQIGIAGNAVEHFITDWIVKIDDITPLCTAIKSMVTQNKIAEAEALLPRETAYPVPDILKNNIGMVADVVE